MIGMAKYIMKGLWRLVQSNKLRKALHEATVDTAIGAIIMFPLSAVSYTHLTLPTSDLV